MPAAPVVSPNAGTVVMEASATRWTSQVPSTVRTDDGPLREAAGTGFLAEGRLDVLAEHVPAPGQAITTDQTLTPKSWAMPFRPLA